MSSANRRRNNNNSRKNNSNLGLGSFSKDFPELSKMGSRVQKNFMTMANNKYFHYGMLFLGVSTILGFLSVRNFNAVVLFLVVAFAMRYFTKNMGLIMLVAVILSNIISVKSTIEGMKTAKKDAKKDDEEDSDDEDEEKDKKENKAKPMKKAEKTKTNAAKKPSEATEKIMAEVRKTMDKKQDGEGMAPIDYKMSKDVEVEEDDDEDMIDIKSTQQAAYENLNKIIGDKGFAKMTQDTEKLMSQQENLAKAMESIGPLVQNAEKMMKGLNLDKFSGMLDKLNGMMGSSPAGASQ